MIFIYGQNDPVDSCRSDLAEGGRKTSVYS